MRARPRVAVSAVVCSAAAAWGCMAPAPAASPADGEAAFLVGTVWRAVDAGAPPGTLRIFQADGTLVMTSCVETYRLSRWTTAGAGRVQWQEDTAGIEADVVSVTDDALHLRLHLVGEDKDERYVPADVPFVCPDLGASPR